MISLTSPIETRAHSWSAGYKLSALAVTTIALFFVEHLLLHLAFLISVFILYVLPGKAFFIQGMKHLKILWPVVLIMAIWHGFTQEYQLGTMVIIRMISAVALANLVTMTTRLADMMDVAHFVARPLRRFGLSSRALELSIALVIRMTPVLMSKGQTLSLAWRARTTKRAGWRIIIPFTVIALDDADHVAEALKARGGTHILEKK
ncbi:ABC transporter permease [Vibrio nigripulchritudo]|uniref:energy-coupling factor transporter transmembrane component T family protein n=1 Tax=Vibrio nigripulchritudo TaxID=28173 RepID=UPI00190970F5|nr:energy-coupling factor transporter transmembrane protein EcfT [Vibrio nigripulchritudo]BCL69275.1 ABC transporter permease [Vibrio nigripulchritudo]BDU30609.1 ABC transporter permease [Vibrio nigripulchritudo]